MRFTLFVCVAFAFAGATPPVAAAGPLSFGAIDGSVDLSGSDAAGVCTARDEEAGAECLLGRTSFGGLPVTRATLTLNEEGRAREVDLRLAAADYEQAYALLRGRWGEPSRTAPWPEWRRFDDDAHIAIARAGEGTRVRYRWPANDVVAAPPSGRIEPAVAISLLLFVLLGLAAGLILARMRRARAAAAPPLTMREALERRLREGHDLQI